MSARDWQKITACGLHPAPLLIGDDAETAPDLEQVETCREWLRLFATPTKTVRHNHNSYGYKHAVEGWTRTLGRKFYQVDRWGRAWTSDYLYIANGAFIEAARLEGYRVVRASDGSPNAAFNLCPRTSARAA